MLSYTIFAINRLKLLFIIQNNIMIKLMGFVHVCDHKNSPEDNRMHYSFI